MNERTDESLCAYFMKEWNAMCYTIMLNNFFSNCVEILLRIRKVLGSNPEANSLAWDSLFSSVFPNTGIVFIFIIIQQNPLNNYRFIGINLQAYYCYMFRPLSAHHEGNVGDMGLFTVLCATSTLTHLLYNKPPPLAADPRMQMTAYCYVNFLYNADIFSLMMDR
jgi:hypothetical protein